MGKRRVKRTNRKPSFFWQAVLILAPMLVLAKLGALALSQDKRMAEHEAALRAQDIAEQTADLLWQELQRDEPFTNQFSFDDKHPGSTFLDYASGTRRIEIDATGRLISPAPFDLAPLPHLLEAATLT